MQTGGGYYLNIFLNIKRALWEILITQDKDRLLGKILHGVHYAEF